MKVSEAIQYKRAVRQYREDPLSEDVVKKILNAGRRAQSSKNTQPWQFIAITNRETLQLLSELGTYAGHMARAALGVVIVTPPAEQRFSIMFDAGQAAAYMQLAAWELGVGSCLATIYESEKAQKLLGIPEGLFIYIAISFGYPLSESDLFRSPQKGGRREITEVVHWDAW